VSQGIGPPESWRFVIPTIAGRLPDLVPLSATRDARVLSVFEDDWRQVELLSRALWVEISECLSEIEQVRTEARGDAGFGRVHTRTGLDDPLLDTGVSVGELVRALGEPIAFIDYLEMEEYDGVVADGYAFSAPNDVTVYGTLDGSQAATAGFEENLRTLFDDPPDSLRNLLETKGLMIVNWLRSAVV
jgi:hypothetical protein